MRKRILWAVVYLLSVMFPFAVEHVSLFSASNPCESVHSEGTATFENLLYWSFTHSGFRRPRAHQVAVVMLAQRDLPPELFQNLCKQRQFLAELVSRLNESGPSLIVIDKFFSPDGCDKEEVNSDLRRTFATVSKQTPIILGRRTFDETEWKVQPKPSELENKQLFSSACLVLAPALAFPDLTKSGQLLLGATRLNADVRKIPLEWLTYPVNFGGQPARTPSLAFVAAQARDPGILQTDTIRRYLANGRHPLTSFLELNAIPEFSSANI